MPSIAQYLMCHRYLDLLEGTHKTARTPMSFRLRREAFGEQRSRINLAIEQLEAQIGAQEEAELICKEWIC
jgi:hypothetical protein